AEGAPRFSGGGPAWEGGGGGGEVEVVGGDFVEEVAEVGGDGEVAAFEALLGGQAGPAAVDSAAANGAAQDEHRGGVTVAGAPVAVLGNRAAELGHRQDDDLAHAVADVACEGGQGRTELAQPVGELTLVGALRDVRVPALHVRETDAQANV